MRGRVLKAECDALRLVRRLYDLACRLGACAMMAR
jgi:hypothetical protein